MNIRVSINAAEILTLAQWVTIFRLLDRKHEITVMQPFDLPQGWVAFELAYASGGTLYGGIDPEGSAST